MSLVSWQICPLGAAALLPEVLRTSLEIAIHNALNVCPDFLSSFSSAFLNSTKVWLHLCLDKYD